MAIETLPRATALSGPAAVMRDCEGGGVLAMCSYSDGTGGCWFGVPALSLALFIALVLGNEVSAQDEELVSGQPRMIELSASDEPLEGRGPSREFYYAVKHGSVLYLSAASQEIDPFLRVESVGGQLLAEDDNSGGGRTAFIRLQVSPGEELWIHVASRAGEAGSVRIKLYEAFTLPEKFEGEIAAARRLLGRAEESWRARKHDEGRALLQDAVECLLAVPHAGEVEEVIDALWNASFVVSCLHHLSVEQQTKELVTRFRECSLPDDHPDVQKARDDLAWTLSRLGDLHGALALQQKVYEVRKRTLPDDHPDLQYARLSLAWTMGRLGNLRGALDLEEKAYEALSRKLPDNDPYLQWARQDLAVTLGKLGDLHRALELQQKAYETRSHTLPDDHPDLQAARVSLAATMVGLGDLHGALQLEQKVYEVWSRALPDDHPDLQLARSNLAETTADVGETARCRALLLEALAGARKRLEFVATTLAPRAHEEANRQLAVLLSSFLSYRDPARPINEACAEELQASVAFRGLSERRARVAEQVRIAAEVDGRLRDLLARAREAQALWLRAYDDSHPTDRQELAQPREEMERAEQELMRRAGAIPEVTEALRPPKLDEFIKLLPPGSAAIVTAAYVRQFPWSEAEKKRPPGRPSVAAFIVASGDAAVRRIDLEHGDKTEELCRAFKKSLAAEARGERGFVSPQAPTEDKAPGPELAKIVRPLFEALPESTKTVYICPDSALAAIPWETLPLNETTVVADRYEVVYLENLSALRPRPPLQHEPSLLVFGGIDYAGEPLGLGETRGAPEVFGVRHDTTSWPALPGTLREASDVRDLFAQTYPQAAARLVQGAQASRATFVNLAPEFRVVHLATHAFVAPQEDWTLGEGPAPGEPWLDLRERAVGFDRGLLAGIVLAGANLPLGSGRDPAVLTASELAGLDLSNCELAVLSACETNVGPRYFGEAVAGLNRALQLAGARNTITSLWKVNDAGTQAFFEAFYEALWLKKLSVPAAFAEARRAVRSRGFGPAVWAAFVLYTTGSAP
ncbi:MAG: CHAT domain-containing tetratricopeptide repeat protein [Planctomycetota bacterium]